MNTKKKSSKCHICVYVSSFHTHTDAHTYIHTYIHMHTQHRYMYNTTHVHAHNTHTHVYTYNMCIFRQHINTCTHTYTCNICTYTQKHTYMCPHTSTGSCAHLHALGTPLQFWAAGAAFTHKMPSQKKKGREIPSLLKINFIQKDRRDAFVPAKLC